MRFPMCVLTFFASFALLADEPPKPRQMHPKRPLSKDPKEAAEQLKAWEEVEQHLRERYEAGRIPQRQLFQGQPDIREIALPTHTKILHLAADGKSLVTAVSDGVRLFSYPDGKELRRYAAVSGASHAAVAVSADGKQVYSASPGVRVWDAESGKETLYSPWDWAERKNSPQPRPLPIRVGIMPLSRTLFHPDGTRVYAADSRFRIRCYESATGRLLTDSNDLGRFATSLDISPDGKWIAVGVDNGFHVLNAKTLGPKFREALAPEPSGHRAFQVHFSSDSKRLFVVGRSGFDGKKTEFDEVQVWDVGTEKRGAVMRPSVNGHNKVTVLPGGRYALCSKEYGEKVDILDLEKGVALGWLYLPNCSPLILTPDGKELVGGEGYDRVRVVSVEEVMKMIPAPQKR